MRRITFHELRHTFGTHMSANGVPLRTLQHWMGHADSKTTQVYAHYQSSEGEADAVDLAFRVSRSRALSLSWPRLVPQRLRSARLGLDRDRGIALTGRIA